MSDLHEVIRSAPTTRRYTDEPVDPEAIRRALDTARFAPSGGNRQGWSVIVVRDAATRQALSDLYQPTWDEYTATWGAMDEDSPRGRMMRSADRYARNIHEIPVHLVVCVEMAALAIFDTNLDRTSICGGASIYPFVQNLMLCLRAEGLGAAMTTILMAAEPQAKELLGIPEGVAIAAQVTVGHRAADHWPKLSRKPVEEFAYAERWGEQL
jgi:nitroreductase